MIVTVISKLVDCLVEKSLVLIDEPETHLHPPLLSAFMRSLSTLLSNRNAVAIVATHSPIVVQEVNQSCVWKIIRFGDEVKVERPNIETFGSNYSEICEDIFNLDINQTGFRQLIDKLVNKYETYEELESAVSCHLGSEAEVIARTLFYIKNQENERQKNENQ